MRVHTLVVGESERQISKRTQTLLLFNAELSLFILFVILHPYILKRDT